MKRELEQTHEEDQAGARRSPTRRPRQLEVSVKSYLKMKLK